MPPTFHPPPLVEPRETRRSRSEPGKPNCPRRQPCKRSPVVELAETSRDPGFTLIEFLVVIIIIGILAAVAIPVFLHQRQKAADASVQSDLRTVAGTVIGIEASSTPLTIEAIRETGLRLSPGVEITVFRDGAEPPCLLGAKVTGVRASQNWVYRTNGGLDPSVSDCSGATLFTLS